MSSGDQMARRIRIDGKLFRQGNAKFPRSRGLSMLAAETIVAMLVGPRQPWIWMMLLTVPLVGWILEYQRARLRSAVGALLDEVAESKNLVKLLFLAPHARMARLQRQARAAFLQSS
jgi:hypothetical protein